MEDTYRHKGLRKALIDSLRKKGIHNELILQAMSQLPRHWFLDAAFADWAYKDVPFPIGNEQTISQPYTVAFQTQLLEVQPKEKILEIGTGSGYQACILAMMNAKVYTLERQEDLVQKTNKLLESIGFGQIRTFYKDGFEGLPRFAPFDKILITCGAKEIPNALLAQLKVGGIMVIPLGDKEQKMLRITKISESEHKTEEFGYFRFVPLLKGTEKTKI